MPVIRFTARFRTALDRWTLHQLNAPLTRRLIAGDR